MFQKTKVERDVLEIINLDLLVPKDHLLRKIDKAVDFTYLYTITEELYCPNQGRPAIDPVILFKIVLLQHLYGIVSLRKTLAEIEMNVAYRWFLGIPLHKKIPHFATVSYNFCHRFTEETIDNVFLWILREIERAGYRESHDKKPFDGPKTGGGMKTVSISTTDPDSGIFQKGEHKRCFAYSAHTVCDKHNSIFNPKMEFFDSL